MILLLLIAAFVTLSALGMLVMLCIQAPAEVTVTLIVISIIIAVAFVILMIFTIRKSKQKDNPYYLISIAGLLIVCLLLFALRNQMYDFLLAVLSPIGLGSLPTDMVN